MTVSKTFTVETRLNQRDNAELIEYAREYIPFYGKILRFTWHRYNNGGKYGMKRHEFNALLQRTFGVSKRIASSVMFEVEGLYKSLYQLKWYEYHQLEGKICKKYKKLSQLSAQVFDLREKAKTRPLLPKESRRLRRLKTNIYDIKQRINRLKQRRDNLLREIESKDLHICFGSKKLFLAQYHLKENNLTSHAVWLEHFRRRRDNRAFFIGSKDETWRNSLLQLSPLANSGNGFRFGVQLRKNTKDKQYARGECTFSYMGGLLARTLIETEHGVSYRIIFRGRKCYLQAMVVLDQDEGKCNTRSAHGAIGLDYNDGFIELAETNETGNLVALKHYALKFHGTGAAAENEIRETVAQIVKRALLAGKDIVIENLDFREKKAATDHAKSGHGKEYNKMLHRFDYSRYAKTIENCCFRKNVGLIVVNPAYTSKIAVQKYCGRKKLVVHQGAAFVIARRGQGFVDKYIKKPRKSKKSA